MKIGMQTWGSHGDIRPFLALAEGLQARGHEVHLVITSVDSEAYAGIVSEAGVRITLVASPVVSPEQAEDMVQRFYSIRNPMTQMAELLRLCFAPVEDAMFRAAQALCADADLVIGHYFMHPLQVAAEKAGVPYASILLSHAAIPSAFNHPISPVPLGKTMNRLLWWLTRKVLNRELVPYSNRLRRQVGLPPVKDVVGEVWMSRQLTLVAVSPQICQRQPDWPASVQVCGFLDMANMELEGHLPEALSTFLQAGEAPFYITLGSWMPRNIVEQSRTLHMLTQATTRANCRAIIQSPSPQECGFQSSDQILYVSTAPHKAIFPHCRAVIHHGGAGTTQTVTLAGKPSIVVSHISEQEHWGQELRRLGIAGKPGHMRSMTAAGLARRIRQVQETPSMGARAAAIASAMQRENGVAEAVERIEQAFCQRS